MDRTCGSCQLCCKLLPVKELAKPSNKRCCYQKHHAGCTIYPDRPPSCRLWSCQWLTNPDTATMRRPDRCHYVIDPIPDFVRYRPEDGIGDEYVMAVVQIWIDPDFPDAHHDPGLRAFLERLADKKNMAALIRTNERDAFSLFAPAITGAGWIELTGLSEKEHTVAEIHEMLFEASHD